MTRPTITVCIVSYHYAHLLAQAIESIICQTLKPDRILVVDDGAHDGAEMVCSKYSGIEPLIREKNLGRIPNFADILNRVNTDKNVMLGADNWFHPQALERMVSEDADIVSTDICLVGEGAEAFGTKVGAVFSDGYWIWKFPSTGDIRKMNFIGSSLYETKIAQRFGYSRGPDEDWELWQDMLLKAAATHRHVPAPLLYYRRHCLNTNQNW